MHFMIVNFRYDIRAIISHFVRWPSLSRFLWIKPTVVRFRSVILPKYSYLNIILNSIIVRNRYNIVIQLYYSFHGDSKNKASSKITSCISPRLKRQLQQMSSLMKIRALVYFPPKIKQMNSRLTNEISMQHGRLYFRKMLESG